MWYPKRNQREEGEGVRAFSLRNTKISTRLTASLLLMCIFPVLLSALFYRNYQRASYDALCGSTRQGLVLYSTIWDFHMGKCERISDGIMMDEIVQQSLNASPSQDALDDERLSHAAKMAFNNLVMWESYMKGFTLYSGDFRQLTSSGFTHLSQDVLNRLLDRFSGDDAYRQWTFMRDEAGNPCIVLLRKVFSASQIGKLLGYVLIYVDGEQLAATMDAALVENAAGVRRVIVDRQSGQIVLWDGLNNTGHIEDRITGYQPEEDPESGYARARVDGADSVIVSEPHEKTGWLILGIMQQSTLDIAFQRSVVPMAIVLLLLLALGVFVSVAIRRSIHRPIGRIGEFTAKVASGDFSRMLNDPYPDEMGALSRRIDGMVTQISELFTKNQEIERRRHQLELEVLQYQINPHFLFNTLNSFQYVAEINGVGSIAKGISCLCQILQHTLANKTAPTLSEEAAITESYIVLQHIKFPGMVSAEFNIAPETAPARVIRFLLQPIVENSILHGMTGDPIRIQVKSWLDRGRLFITVEDDGMGFDLHAPAHSRSRFSGIGLNNVRERLSMEFSGDFRFNMESQIGAGTKTTIELPFEPTANAEEGEDA